MLNSIYWAIDPVIFSIGPFDVRWYGVAYVLGFICFGIVALKTAKRWQITFTFDALLEVLVCVMVGVILGARLGYVVFYGEGYYWTHPGEIFAFSQGGMSFHGGLVGGILGLAISSRLIKMPFLSLGDLAAIGAPIGLFFGRCANFINGELWGAPTDLPWGVMFGGEAGMIMRHPSQLYEALLEGVVIFIVLFALSRKRPPYPRGTFSGVFLVLYAVFRCAVEFVREPDIQLGYLYGDWLTMGMVLSIPVLIAGICFLVHAHRAKHPQEGQRLPE